MFRTAAAPPRRPFLASYLGRSGRASRWLPEDTLQVLDVGCASGYGSAGVAAAGRPVRVVVGVERDRRHLAYGWQRLPWLTLLEGDATALPLPDSCADAVLILDVVEHLADPVAAIAEASSRHASRRNSDRQRAASRTAAPGRRAQRLFVAATAAPVVAAAGGADRVRLGGRTGTSAAMNWVGSCGRRSPSIGSTRTGLGIAEFVSLARLLLRATAGAPRTCAALAWLYLLAYLAEDPFPFGRLGYHLTVRARPLPVGDTAMTRVLLACWPFEGHLFPQMSMAIALRDRGAEVAFYTDGSKRELIEAEGFEVFEFDRVAPAWERVYGRDRGTGRRSEALALLRAARRG